MSYLSVAWAEEPRHPYMGGDVELITAPNGAVINAYKEKGFLPVTRPVLDGDVLTVAAVKMQFFTEYHSDTDDCLTVWLPGKKIALNNLVWPMMPNFYTPRGATYRDPFNWIDGLYMIRSLEPETLLSTHTRPIHGKEKIKENINPFMDGIAFILPGKNDYGRTSIGNP